MNQQIIWQTALARINQNYPSNHVKMWFSNVRLTDIEKDCVWLTCDNGFKKDYLEKKYLEPLKSLFSEIVGKPIDVKIKVVNFPHNKKSSQSAELGPLFDEVTPTTTASAMADLPNRSGLSPNYTFVNFIVGNSNNVAYAAAQAVAKNPGHTYNPLFIFGGVGVGKTHLMQAVGNTIVSQFLQKKILYFTTEKFTNDFIEALSTKHIKEFRERYRKADVILVDDIQFLSGREGTQEEFFHTFNELHMSGRQIILSSDRKPQQIEKLEDRLSSRFLGGLTVDIGQPDYEMRVAILKDKAKRRNIPLSDETIGLVASLITTNTRELEGALTKISLWANAYSQPITTELAQQALGQPIKTSTNTLPSPKEVLASVANYFQIKHSDLVGPKRDKQLVISRQIAMYILRHELGTPLVKVGQLLGNRDHTTVMHGVEKIGKMLDTNDETRKMVLTIKQQLTRSAS